MLSVAAIFSDLEKLSGTTQFLLAYSGGLDSRVLLHLMQEIRQQHSFIQLRAVHVNHHLSPHANHWEQHCAQICAALKIPLTTHSINIDRASKQSMEEQARQLRLRCFAQELLENECLLTAHHLDDQAETLLLQLARGAGLKGLAAMPAKKKINKGFMLRPLLKYTRQELRSYAEHHHLQWIQDESNDDLTFARNFTRHEILPLMQRRWPGIVKNLSRVAHHCAEANELLDDLAQLDFEKIAPTNPYILPLDQLLLLSEKRQRNVLRYWLKNLNIRPPHLKQMKHWQIDLLQSRYDASPVFSWEGWNIRRYRNELHIESEFKIKNIERMSNAQTQLSWNLLEPLSLPNNLGKLHAIKKIGVGLRADLDGNKITVSFRQGGERCRLNGRQGSHSLKKLFQEWKVPFWKRGQVPLIYYEDQLIAVVGYCICSDFETKAFEPSLQLIIS